MNGLRIALAFPAALIMWWIISNAIVVIAASYLGEDFDNPAWYVVTILMDALATFISVFVGTRIAPRRHAVVISYVLYSVPLIALLSDLATQLAEERLGAGFVYQIVGILIGIAASWLYTRKKYLALSDPISS